MLLNSALNGLAYAARATAAFDDDRAGSWTAGAIGVMATAAAPTIAVVPAIIWERSEICMVGTLRDHGLLTP